MFRTSDNSKNIKYVSRSKAVVINNVDPKQQGRIQVKSPVVGDTNWIPYLRMPGLFDVPRIGDIVYIECDLGEMEYIIAWGNLTTPREGSGLDFIQRTDGTLNGDSEPSKINNSFYLKDPTGSDIRFIPTNRGLFTPAGHLLEMDDGISKLDDTGSYDKKINADALDNLTTKNKGIRLTTSNGRKIHLLEDEENNVVKILIQDAKGNKIEINEINDEITIATQGKIKNNALSHIENTTAASMINVATDNILNNCDNYNINAGGDVTIQADGAIVINTDSTVTINHASTVVFSSPLNIIGGGLVAANVVNNDPITGIPLTPVGGITAGT